MREHQIVITLKPDQFLAVQRLARAANAKSMGIFVRQQLLAALGIDGDAAKTQAGAGNGNAAAAGQADDLQTALAQIKRLHGELKTFVAESLSLYNVAAAGEPTPEAAAGDPPVSAVPAPAADALESTAERTFAISPRLGPIAGDAAARHAMSTRSEISAGSSEPAARHEPVKREQHRLHHPHGAGSDLLDVPYKAASEPDAVVGDPLHKLLPAEEELTPLRNQLVAAAALEPAQPFELEQTWMPGLPEPEDGPAFDQPADVSFETGAQSQLSGTIAEDVPPSLAQRLANAFYGVDGTATEEDIVEHGSAADGFAPGSALSAAADVSEASTTVSAEAAPGTGAGEGGSSAPPEEAKPKPAKPPGYPSLSGSPPPKRRQL